MGERYLEYLNLDEVRPAPHNPKLHNLDVLDDSLIRFGFTEPLLMCERTGYLVAGHGRLDALKNQRDRGGSVPSGIKVENEQWYVPVVRGWESQTDEEFTAYLIASNRTSEIGGWDSEMLLKDLDMLDDYEGIGYTLEQAQALQAQVLDLPKTPSDKDLSDDMTEVWGIIVECRGESEQTALLQRLDSEGFSVRALMA